MDDIAREQRQYLARNHYGAKKDALTRPLLERDLKMRFGSVDIDKRNEDGGDGDLGTGEDIGDKGGKCGMFGAARESAAATRRGWTTHGIVDGINDAVDDIF